MLSWSTFAPFFIRISTIVRFLLVMARLRGRDPLLSRLLMMLLTLIDSALSATFRSCSTESGFPTAQATCRGVIPTLFSAVMHFSRSFLYFWLWTPFSLSAEGREAPSLSLSSAGRKASRSEWSSCLSNWAARWRQVFPCLSESVILNFLVLISSWTTTGFSSQFVF